MHRLTELTLDHPKIAAAVLAVLTAVLGAGAPRVPIEHGSRVLVGEGHPELVGLDSVVESFGGGLPIEIGWECGENLPCRDALDPQSLEMAHRLTREIEHLPYVRKVHSPTNTSLIVPSPGGVLLRRFVEDERVVADHEALAQRAASDDLWVGQLISADRSMAVVIVQPADNSSDTGEFIFDRIRSVLEPFGEEGFDFRMNGMVVRAVLSGRDLQDSTARILPALVLVIAVVLRLLAGSTAQVAIALATMGVGLLWTRGLMGWLAWPQDGIHQVLAPLVLIVGVCDAVHLLTRASEQVGDARQRVLAATSTVVMPCLLTTATTAVALASFTTSSLGSFARFGLISAFGVCACFVLTFTLLPLGAVRLLPLEQAGALDAHRWNGSLHAIARFGERHAHAVIALSFALLALGGTGWTLFLRADTDWERAFGEHSDVSQWIEFFEKRRGATDTMEIQLTAPTGSTFEDPTLLSVVDQLSRSLEEIDGLGRARSVVDLLDRLDANLSLEPTSLRRFPPTRGGNAELLELLAFDDPELLAPWLTLDRASARVSVGGSLEPQSEGGRLVAEARARAAEIVPSDWGVLFTGLMTWDDAWVTEVQSTQLRSFPTAFLLVFVLASLFLRSVRLGLAAMLPTLVPIVVTLGTMGWLGMGLDIGRAMIGAVVIGIGVDDAIHFLDAYRRHRRSRIGAEEAVGRAIRETGRAIITTSIALSLGFLTLMASAWQTIASFGFFVSITVIAALISTLFLLPALLLGPMRRSEEARAELD